MSNIKSRLKEKYVSEVLPVIDKEFDIKNVFARPVISKIVINSGIGQISKSKEDIEKLSADLATVAGQKPSVRLAKVSIATFNLRAGQPVGLAVTLRGVKMYDFLDKLMSIVLPRLRDFRGVPLKGFDKAGNYTLGLSEHTIFPDLDLSRTVSPKGLEITLVIKNSNQEKSKRLLALLGMPFEKEAGGGK